MSQTSLDPKAMNSFFERKKTEKNLLSSKTPDISFRSQIENPSEMKRFEASGIQEESHLSESREFPPRAAEKNIENFFSNPKKSEEIEEDVRKTKKPQKRPVSAAKRKASPGKPSNYAKLDEKERERLFLNTYDENLRLKKKETELTNDFKIVNKKLRDIETRFAIMKKDTEGPDERSKGFGNENLKVIDDLARENKSLKNQLQASKLAKQVAKSKVSGVSRKLMSSLAGGSDERLIEKDKIIEQLKRRLKESEIQLKARDEAIMKSGLHSGIGNQSDLHSKNIKLASLQTRYDELLASMESQKIHYENSKKRAEDLNEQLFREREETNRLKKEIRALELSVDHIKDVEAKVKELEDEKKNLNMRLKDLCESPFIKQHEERATLQYQIRKLESDLQKLSLENKSLNELYFKATTELDRTQKTLDERDKELKAKIEQAAELKATLDMKDKQLGPFKDLDRDEDAFLKALGTVKWQGEEPAWYKLDFLERPQKLDIKDSESLLKEIERLRLEKGELAAQVERSQTLLKIQMESEEEQNKIHQAQIATLELQLKGAILRSNELSKLVDLKGFGSHEGMEVYEKNGTKYDDRVSVFSDDAMSEADTEPGTNYFELWVGDAELDEGAIRSLVKANKDVIFDVKRVLTFLIVDFFNHDSQNSSIAEGTHTNFNYQMSFKVLCDEIFLSYLENGFVKIELYVSEGMEAFPIAKANIPLKDLVKKHLGEGIAPAMSSSITFFGSKNEIVGLMNYRMRMKFPIAESLKWQKQKRELGIIAEETQWDESVKRKRKLVIIIDKGSGLSNRYNTFVAYSLNGRDYNTTPQPGQTPRWDYTGIHEIDYDENFVGYLKTNILEFMIVDDNVPLVAASNLANEFNDLIGFARLSLNGLINNEIIDSIIPIHGPKSEKRGTLHVKIFWHEGTLPKKPMPEDSLITKSWEQELILRIGAALRSKQLTLESAFMIFDQDRDKLVNIHDFQSTLLGTLNLQIPKDEIELLYQRMPLPFTKENFLSVFGQHLPSMGPPGTKPDISKINLMLQSNTHQLSGHNLQVEYTKKLIADKIGERVKQTSQISVFKELDMNQDGFISILELKTYFLKLGMKFSDDEILNFVKAVDLDRNNKIDVKEFLNFVLAGFMISSSDHNQDFMTSERMRENNDFTLSSRSGSPRKKIEGLVTRMMDNILNYMRNTKLTFLKLYEKIDKNHDNFLSKSELNEFLKKIGLEVTFNETNALLNHLDENKDNKISIKEFVENIKDFAANRQLYSLYADEEEGNNLAMETVNEKIVEYIADYLSRSKITIPDFFNSIDRNDDGIISREELSAYFIQTLKLTLSREEQSAFFNYLDQNRDNKISIPEVMKIMKPSIEKALKKDKTPVMNSSLSFKDGSKTSLASPLAQDLKEKLADFVNKHLIDFRSAFLTRGSEKGFIDQDEFKEILREFKKEVDGTNVFLPKEINAIVEQFCEKGQLGINYEKFLAQFKKGSFKTTTFSVNEGSSRDLLNSRRMAREVFGKIGKVVRDKNINVRDAFRTFDLDNDGTIDAEEFKKAFDAMKLPYSQEDVEEIIGVIGSQGKVNYNKFLEALKLK